MPGLHDAFADASSWTLATPWEDDWYPCNPSIADSPHGYAAIVTCRNGHYPTDDPFDYCFAHDGGHKTRNFFALLDAHLAPATPWSELETPGIPVVFTDAQGVEDPRLYWDNGWHYSGTLRQHHASGEPRTAVCSVDDGLLEILDAPPSTWVKNQMPTGSTPSFLDVMASDPTLHGGAVMPHGEGWLGIAHEVEWPGRRYWHRFVVFDRSGLMTQHSDRFSFDGHPIEFASGIVVHGSNVVVSYGVQDREAKLASIPIAEVERHCGF